MMTDSFGELKVSKTKHDFIAHSYFLLFSKKKMTNMKRLNASPIGVCSEINYVNDLAS